MKKLSVVMSLGLMTFPLWAKVQHSIEAPFIPGEVLVKVKPGHVGKFLAKKSLLDAEVKKEIRTLTGQYFLLKSDSKSAQNLLSSLRDLPEVSFAEPNYLYKIVDAPADPLYGKLWGLSNTGSNEPDRNGGQSTTPGIQGADIDAERAWTITRGSKKVKIAVIDTGIDYNHPDLKNNIWKNEKEIAGNGIDDDQNGYIDDVRGWNAFKDNGDPMDGNSHGTHCAGTIGAEHNNVGVSGMMSEVTLVPVKFLSDEGSGSLADAVEAIDYATKVNVDLMSNSWGGGGYSQALFDSIKLAKDKGILFVAAAGNDASNNDSRPSYPAGYEIDNVISVASHTAQDTLSSFSNYGRRTVHVAAPGTNILSSTPNGEYKVLSGTSMATPHVSGALGLLLTTHGRMPVAEVRNRLMATTTPVQAYRRTTLGGGRVNAYYLLTDTRIPRPGPSDAAWRSEVLTEAFETAHPYANNAKITKSYTFPGAKYIKLVVEKFDTESGYDFLSFKDARGLVIEKMSGTGANYETDYAETETISIEFTSDSSQTRWGATIKEIKVVY